MVQNPKTAQYSISFIDRARNSIEVINEICRNIIYNDFDKNKSSANAIQLLITVLNDVAKYISDLSFFNDTLNHKRNKLIEVEQKIMSCFSDIFDKNTDSFWIVSSKYAYELRKLILNFVDDIKEYRNTIGRKTLQESHKAPTPPIPSELPAPIRIAVSKDRISLTAPKHKSGQLAEKSIKNLCRSSCDIIEDLIEELSQPTSNVDRRIINRLKRLFKELNVPFQEIAIEAVGLQWQVTSDVIALTQETIPDVLMPQIQRVLSTIHNLLVQFEEWHQYEAITIVDKINSQDTCDLAQIGNEMAAELASKREIIDSQIGDRLHDMAIALSDGLVRRETIMLPLIGSLSNIFAGISQFILDRGDFIIKSFLDVGTIITDPTTLGRSVIILSFCTFIINKFAPRLTEYAPFNWLKTIQPTAVKYYSALSKSGKG